MLRVGSKAEVWRPCPHVQAETFTDAEGAVFIAFTAEFVLRGKLIFYDKKRGYFIVEDEQGNTANSMKNHELALREAPKEVKPNGGSDTVGADRSDINDGVESIRKPDASEGKE